MGIILLAKYISAMLCLVVPLLLSLLLAMILLTTFPTFSLRMPDFLRIGGIVFTSLVYLSVFYLIGLLMSAMTQRTGTALMLSMFVWGFFSAGLSQHDCCCDFPFARATGTHRLHF